MFRVILLFVVILSAPFAGAQVHVICWPQDSGLKGKAFYVCDLQAQPGTALTGSQLMAALAELEPVPAAFAIEAGEDANRGGVRRILARVEKYALPIVAGVAAGGVFQISTFWRVALATLPGTVPQIREWVGAAVPPDWTPPEQLLPNSDVAFDSHGNASIVLYTRRDGGVRRVTIAAQQPVPLRTAPATAAQNTQGMGIGRTHSYLPFQPSSWLTLLREAQARHPEDRGWWLSWSEAWEREYRLAEAEEAQIRMNFGEGERLLAEGR